MSLSARQVQIVDTTNWVTSAVSIVGILFIIVTYSFSPLFDKPINRLMFFAAWGNLGASVSSLISELGPASQPLGSSDASGLCQFQGFLVQMFRGVDCYWCLCMAINVYLVFFRGYTTDQLQRLDRWYLLSCYGLSFIPALAFVFISTEGQGHVYGPAIIWCWITEEWDWMRLVFLYGIGWIAILFALVVYIMAGKVIWSKRQHLDGFLNPLKENPFTNTITTEIEITYEERGSIIRDPSNQGILEAAFEEAQSTDPYSIKIQAAPQVQPHVLPAALRMRSLTRDVAESEPNADAWLYARVAILFFIAMIITWVPSSINRIWQMVNKGQVNFPLNYLSSLVFALQGVWNLAVYVVTSQTACRRLARQIWGRIWERKGARKMDMEMRKVRRASRVKMGGKQRLESVDSK